MQILNRVTDMAHLLIMNYLGKDLLTFIHRFRVTNKDLLIGIISLRTLRHRGGFLWKIHVLCDLEEAHNNKSECGYLEHPPRFGNAGAFPMATILDQDGKRRS